MQHYKYLTKCEIFQNAVWAEWAVSSVSTFSTVSKGSTVSTVSIVSSVSIVFTVSTAVYAVSISEPAHLRVDFRAFFYQDFSSHFSSHSCTPLFWPHLHGRTRIDLREQRMPRGLPGSPGPSRLGRKPPLAAWKSFTCRRNSRNKLASSVDAIAMSEIWNCQSFTDWPTDRGRC